MDPRNLILALMRRMPLGVANALAWALAWTWWWLIPVRRRVAVDNLRHALPDVAPRPTLTRLMHDLILGYIEFVQHDRKTVEVIVEGWEAMKARPGVLLAGHFGSWDNMLIALADRAPVSVFLRMPTDPWARQLVHDVRAAHGVEGFEDRGSMADACRAIESGRTVFFVQDQHYAKGMVLPFFGRPCRISPGYAAAVARGYPAWVIYTYREGVGRHRVRVDPFPVPPLTGDKAADVRAINIAILGWYEERIRERPWSWLWLHRRWRE